MASPEEKSDGSSERRQIGDWNLSPREGDLSKGLLKGSSYKVDFHLASGEVVRLPLLTRANSEVDFADLSDDGSVASWDVATLPPESDSEKEEPKDRHPKKRMRRSPVPGKYKIWCRECDHRCGLAGSPGHTPDV